MAETTEDPDRRALGFGAKQRFLETVCSAQAGPFRATVVIAAPFGEELFFRGLAFPAMRRGLGPSDDSAASASAAIMTGAMFSLIHLDLVGFLGLWEIAILLAVLRLGTGSLWTAVICHAINNGVAGGRSLLGGRAPAHRPP